MLACCSRDCVCQSSVLYRFIRFAGKAKTAETECTAECRKYQHPVHKHLQLWDTPGGNTVQHPGKSYFKDKCLYAFDLLVIVGAERLLHLDLHLISVATLYGLPTVVVRSKMDTTYEARKRSNEWNDKSHNELMTDLRQSISSNYAGKLVDVLMLSHHIIYLGAKA